VADFTQHSGGAAWPAGRDEHASGFVHSELEGCRHSALALRCKRKPATVRRQLAASEHAGDVLGHLGSGAGLGDLQEHVVLGLAGEAALQQQRTRISNSARNVQALLQHL
jgi:hypothetical protein